ncbi:MAG: ribosome maturation factor RimP [Pseudomonadota bacterium]
MIEPAIEDLGYQLVRVVVSGRDGGTVQVMIDHAERGVHIDDCVQVTREIDPLLDAHHQGLRLSHRLEVSTPGIDRPLVRPADVLEFIGHEVKLELKTAIDNRKRFRGWLDDFADEEVRLSTDLSDGNGLQVLGFHISAIDTIKLILTDELIEAMQARRAADEADAAQAAAPDGPDADEPDRPADPAPAPTLTAAPTPAATPTKGDKQ